MITAIQAKEKTQERITQIAKEFITNEVSKAIDEAIKGGYFFATISFEGVVNPIKTGPEVVKLLKQDGYEVEHVYSKDSGRILDNYITIEWED